MLASQSEDKNVAALEKLQIVNGPDAVEASPQKHMINCCRLLVNSLSGIHPQLVADTQAFCRALQRIALLHEEHWLYMLGQFDEQMFRMVTTPLMAFDTSTTTAQQNENVTNSRQHQQAKGVRAYLDKVYSSLCALYADTCGSDKLDSEKECQFAATFGDQIKDALANLEEHENVAGGNARKAWHPFRKIYSALNKRAMQRSALSLSVQKMSPNLAEELGPSCVIPMPGQEQHQFDGTTTKMVMVQRMAKVAYVDVLPTKTRPKKIAFIGDDGKTYTFLFKGHENLYMDTRLMQLLNVCNAIFDEAKNQRQMDTSPSYACVTYSVIPLAQRSGLIQWVDGAVPLFQIYRKWRVRQSKFMAEIEENKKQRLATLPSAFTPQQQIQQQKGGMFNIAGATSTTTGECAKRGGGGKKQSQQATEKQSQNVQKLANVANATAIEPGRPLEQFYNNLKAQFAEKGNPKEQFADRQRWPRKLGKIGEFCHPISGGYLVIVIFLALTFCTGYDAVEVICSCDTANQTIFKTCPCPSPNFNEVLCHCEPARLQVSCGCRDSNRWKYTQAANDYWSSYEYWTFVVNVYGYCIGPFIAPLIVSLILLFIQKWCFPVRVDFNDITGILTADKIPVLTADKIPIGFVKHTDLDELKREKDTQLADLKREKDTQLADLKREKDTQLADLKREKDTQLADLKREKDEQLASVILLTNWQHNKITGLQIKELEMQQNLERISGNLVTQADLADLKAEMERLDKKSMQAKMDTQQDIITTLQQIRQLRRAIASSTSSTTTTVRPNPNNSSKKEGDENCSQLMRPS